MACSASLLQATAAPRVVLVGAAGHGKSTVVEKLTGISGLSSNASTSFTKCAQAYASTCGGLRVVDTPGGDAMGDSALERLHTNMYIAQALSIEPVSLIVVVLRAETRLDAVVGKVRAYVEAFVDFADNVAVCVTHMDTVAWPKEQCQEHLLGKLDLYLGLFCGIETGGDELRQLLLELCSKVKPIDITINSGNFLEFFRIHDNNRKILRSVQREVEHFRMAVREFYDQLAALGEQDRPDAVFEFQAFMLEEIFVAQARVSEEHGFDEQFLDPENSANVTGHLAHLTLRLRSELLPVRQLAFGYQSDAGASDLRMCPHCGLVWAKIAGCPDTYCGRLMHRPDARRSAMATFSFEFRDGRLVMQRGEDKVVPAARPTGKGAGCGQRIRWDEMKPVPVPPEFVTQDAESVVTVSDVPLMRERLQRTWGEFFSIEWEQAMRKFIVPVASARLGGA